MLDVWFGKQDFFNNFIEAYFTYKIHPFQLYILVILVSFLSGKAITILSFRHFPSHTMRSFVFIYMIIPAPSSGQPLIFLSTNFPFLGIISVESHKLWSLLAGFFP